MCWNIGGYLTSNLTVSTQFLTVLVLKSVCFLANDIKSSLKGKLKNSALPFASFCFKSTVWYLQRSDELFWCPQPWLMGNPTFPLAPEDEGLVWRQQRQRAASAVMSEAWCWELQEHQAHEKCKRREAPLALAPVEFFSICNDANISWSICSPLNLVAKNLLWRAQVPFPERAVGPVYGLLLPCQKVPQFPASQHICVQFFTPPCRRCQFYSKLNKNRVGFRFSWEKQVPGALGRITEYGISFPTQEQMVCISSSCDLSLFLIHQISDPMDHKYSLDLQPWK